MSSTIAWRTRMVTDCDSSVFEEACAQADAEEARQSESEEVARLAKLPKLEYDRQREDAAAYLGVRVANLDKAVRAAARTADSDAQALPHWQVEPTDQALRQDQRHDPAAIPDAPLGA